MKNFTKFVPEEESVGGVGNGAVFTRSGGFVASIFVKENTARST